MCNVHMIEVQFYLSGPGELILFNIGHRLENISLSGPTGMYRVMSGCQELHVLKIVAHSPFNLFYKMDQSTLSSITLD